MKRKSQMERRRRKDSQIVGEEEKGETGEEGEKGDVDGEEENKLDGKEEIEETKLDEEKEVERQNQMKRRRKKKQGRKTTVTESVIDADDFETPLPRAGKPMSKPDSNKLWSLLDKEKMSLVENFFKKANQNTIAWMDI
ncbi:hypothetical protein IFM89_036693 [Coptis chinensis]|uniref:Uncharacterized protein n=1 Tax=Coptis chinensis TaxID=261450 RepID=A0A835I5C6_9MAGN|nr:hypothetical protein IFM89_036693 [Coptis chinensis]